mgnify:CR=1 FL=1
MGGIIIISLYLIVCQLKGLKTARKIINKKSTVGISFMNLKYFSSFLFSSFSKSFRIFAQYIWNQLIPATHRNLIINHVDPPTLIAKDIPINQVTKNDGFIIYFNNLVSIITKRLYSDVFFFTWE